MQPPPAKPFSGRVTAGAIAEALPGAQETHVRREHASSKVAENAYFRESFNELLQSVQDIVKQFLQAQAQADPSIIRNM